MTSTVSTEDQIAKSARTEEDSEEGSKINKSQPLATKEVDLSMAVSDSAALQSALDQRDRWRIGKTLVFGYWHHNPLFTIGPHCILISRKRRCRAVLHPGERDVRLRIALLYRVRDLEDEQGGRVCRCQSSRPAGAVLLPHIYTQPRTAEHATVAAGPADRDEPARKRVSN
ncbi:MAG: hypothetical protein P4M11_04170 [Candidatus Pacebacteria bacterium]|nr:hypothetical protein [Candidatus Paceibacterota bacterium]